MSYRWSIEGRPAGSTANLTSPSSPNPTLAFSGERDIGNWVIRLDLDDNEGERSTFRYNLTVPNSPLILSVTGARSIDAPQPISLQATPATDADGGDMTFVWDILDSPRGRTDRYHTGTNATGASLLPILTTESDIGTWRFRVTATDNEMPPASDSEEIEVVVRNLPPTITFVGDPDINIGDAIQVETTVLNDRDGGDLNFQWDIVQSPQSAPRDVQVRTGFKTGAGADGASVNIPTTVSYAGTWILKLTARDNDRASNSEVVENFTVFVDAPPEARITTTSGRNIVGNLSFPFELLGDTSVDPDSPCPRDPAHCHNTSDPPVRSITPGIRSYTWWLIEVPGELVDRYPLGRVDEVLSIPARAPNINIGRGVLRTGNWTFQLDVRDAEDEDNVDSETFTLTVFDEEFPPVAIVNLPTRYNVGVTSVITENIILNGSLSFDPDNYFSGGTGGALPGINNYQWEVLNAPIGCTPPTITSGPSSSVVNLYTAGSVLDPACQGFWRIKLTVTDDDMPAKNNSAETSIIIGNCPELLCILYPTTVSPQLVAFSDRTDVLIYYQLDSTLYDAPAFLFGSFARMEIFHEDDLTRPFYVAYDPNVLASNRGGFLVFHWNGYGISNERPRRGKYRVRITLLNSEFGISTASTEQPQDIWIETVEPKVLATSDRYKDFNRLTAGTEQLNFNYELTGMSLSAPVDTVKWRVLDESNREIAHGTATSLPSLMGTITWNGAVGSSVISPGRYKFEVEALRGGASLGVSDAFQFVVYRLEIIPSVGTASSTLPGTFIFVNSDDDNRNNVSDSLESAAGENDLISVDFKVVPPIDGIATLSSSSASAPFKLWETAGKAGERAIPANYNVPIDTGLVRFFMEGQTAARSNLTMQLQTTDGVTLGPASIALTIVEVGVMEDTNNDFIIGIGDTQKLYVRPGLWDFAFRMPGDPGIINSLFNEEDQSGLASSGNPENFIGRDSRRFNFLVKNPVANTNTAIRDEIPLANFEWFTVRADGTNDDFPPTNRSITLVETGNDTGIFVSPALMIVTDHVDLIESTNTGLAAYPGSAAYDQMNHRTRKVSEVDGAVVGRYRPINAGGPQFDLNIPLFNRNPEERRVMRVRVFNFSDTLNLGIPPIPPDTINNLTTILKERYAAIGIQVGVSYNPVTDIINLPMGSAVNLNAVASFTIPGGFNTLSPSADQSILINLVRMIDPASAANIDTIYVLFIGHLTSMNRGESFPDGWIPSGSAAKNFVFVAGRNTSVDYTAAHEIGHMLTNETLTAGESAGTTPGWASGGHYGGAQGTFNLMRAGTIATTPLSIDNTKRLWDDTATHTVRQIQRILMSRFLKNP